MLLIDEIFRALSQQSVTVPGTSAVELVVAKIATNIKALKAQRLEIATQVENPLEDYPLSAVLMSMPGVGIKTAATILLSIGDASRFPTAGHHGAYAGIAPVTHRSGTSIKGEFPAWLGNKQLKIQQPWSSPSHEDGLVSPNVDSDPNEELCTARKCTPGSCALSAGALL